MANGHGGYRRPKRPAAVSGPGKYSKRTDGGVGRARLSDPGYGEQKAFTDQQAQAPMGGSQPQPIDKSGVIPLDAPSRMPDQPVTAGSALGLGPGSEAIGMTNSVQQPMDEQTRDRVRAYMPMLMYLASQPDASPETRQFVRQLRGDLL